MIHLCIKFFKDISHLFYGEVNILIYLGLIINVKRFVFELLILFNPMFLHA